jgi:hypothetical protein
MAGSVPDLYRCPKSISRLKIVGIRRPAENTRGSWFRIGVWLVSSGFSTLRVAGRFGRIPGGSGPRRSWSGRRRIAGRFVADRRWCSGSHRPSHTVACPEPVSRSVGE